MPVPDLPLPSLVKRPNELKSLAGKLTREPVIAVDTESNSLFAYQEQVCLIQFSTPDADYLVDPLALDDLSPLGPIFADPAVEKVFHAAEYDLMCLKRDFEFRFSGIFDTMLAARILGRRAIGLGALLASEFDVQLNKRYQRANWGQRPLPPHLLAYARLDTHYLIPLRDILRRSLKSSGRWPIAQEDFNRLCLVEDRTTNNHHDCWRINGAYELNPQQAAVLQELCHYRDDVARRLDRPVFKVFNDHTLVAIARESPTTGEHLRQLPGMTRNRLRHHEQDLLDCVARGLAAKPLERPRTARPDGDFLARVEALRQWRKRRARKMGVNSDVVLPRDLMHAVARRAPLRRDELAEVMGKVPWRLEKFGEEILDQLAHV